MDDKYLYASCWLHGSVLQFDITDPFKPKLVGQVNACPTCLFPGPVEILGAFQVLFGGVAWEGSSVKVVDENGQKKVSLKA